MMEFCSHWRLLCAALVVCGIAVSSGCADAPEESSDELAFQNFHMKPRVDGRVVANFHKAMAEQYSKAMAEQYGQTDVRPVRQRRPYVRNAQDRPLANSFGSSVEGQVGRPRPNRRRPASSSSLPDYVLAAVEHKVQGVSSFVQSIPEFLTTISSTVLGAPRPTSNEDDQSQQYPQAGSANHLTGSNSGTQRPSSRPVSNAGNRVSVHSPIYSNAASVSNNRQDNPFQIVVVEPSKNDGNRPSGSQVPVNTQGGLDIPVASGGAVPPSGYVPNDEPFVLNNFHFIDPNNNGNPGVSNADNGVQSQRPQATGSNSVPTQNANQYPNRVPASGGDFFNQQGRPSSSNPSQPGQGVSGFDETQTPLGGYPTQAGQSTNSFSGVQNGFNQQELSIYNVVNGIQEFTLDLISTFRALGTKGNVVFSPISITSLLSLLTLGTKDLSSQEIEVALHLPNSQSSTSHHEQYENILRRLNHESSGVNISTASRLFLEENIPVFNSFTTQASQHYNCSVSLESFRQRPSQTQKRVNQWVEEATQGKITDFISAPFNPDTMFVAANTIYFSGQWETPFPEYFTGPRDFDTGRSVVRIPMMTNVFQTPHFYSPEYNLDITSVPYVGGEFSMIIMLPRESPQEKSIKLLERQLDTFLIDEFISNMTTKSVSLSLPKMRLRMKSSLIESLSQLNIKSIFSPLTADFSGLSSTKPLWVSQFLHEAIMDVTEVGTVAAAVSAVTLDRMGGYQRINVNKPAIIFIRDNVTRLPLFWVRLTKPESIS